MPNWWPLNSPQPVAGTFAWDWQDRPKYPDDDPDFPFIQGWTRVNILDGTGWNSRYRQMENVQVQVPPVSAIIGGDVQSTYNAIQLWHYPLDETPSDFIGVYDRFEVWTGPNRTGTKFTEIDGDTINAAIPSEQYIVDYASGMVRFSGDQEGDTLYLFFFGAQGAVRPAMFNHIQDNVTGIIDALFNGFIHELRFVMDIGSEQFKVLDFSGITGIPSANDWLLYMGDGGGALTREMGWNAANLTLYSGGLLPVIDSFGKVGSYGSPDVWQEGGFNRLAANTELKTPLLHGIGGLLTIDDNVLIDLDDPGDTKTFKIDGGTDGDDGLVTVDHTGKVLIEVPDVAGVNEALTVSGSGGKTAILANANLTSDRVTALDCSHLLNDFDQLQRFNQSNAINASGWSFASPFMQTVLGGVVKVQRVWAEIESTAAEGITNIKVWERDPNSLNLITLFDSGVIDWSGTYARYFLDIAPVVSPDRAFGIEVTCANSVANAVKISGLWLDVILEAN